MDSGAYTELTMHGAWLITPRSYVDLIHRCQAERGGMDWAAPMDWPTEIAATSQTGLTVREHQRRTVGNYLDLKSIDADLPLIPVVQGQTVKDYLHCVDLYSRAGIDLRVMERVGVGSICRRQGEPELTEILTTLGMLGLRLHGFGLSSRGVLACWPYLASCDSMAWSYAARARANGGAQWREGCTHRACNYCLTFAMEWRAQLLAQLDADMTAAHQG